MARTYLLFAILIIVAATLVQAAENPLLGNWNCTSDDGHGAVGTWLMTVKETGGKLVASMRGGQDDITIDLVDPQFDGKTFTFKVVINPEETVTIVLTLDGDKLEGKFDAGKNSDAGTFKAVREKSS